MSRLVLAALLAVTGIVAGSAQAGCVLEVNGQFSAYRCDDGFAGRSDDRGRLPPEASRVTGARLAFRDLVDGVGDSSRLTLPTAAGRHGWVKAQPW